MKQICFVVLSINVLVLLVGQPDAHSQMSQQRDTNTTSLLDPEKVATHLQLNASQVLHVFAFIGQIQEVIRQDEEKIAEMRARFRSDDKPGLFEKLKLRGQRSNRIDQIESLVDNIKDELTQEQLERFSDIVMPELPKLSPKSFESD